MADPKTAEEYNQKFQANTRYTGVGLDTMIHTPCPFCAEPDFMNYKFMEVKEVMKKGATCKHCGRSVGVVFHVDQPGNVQFEFVLTGGDDPPEYMATIRRMEAKDVPD